MEIQDQKVKLIHKIEYPGIFISLFPACICVLCKIFFVSKLSVNYRLLDTMQWVLMLCGGLGILITSVLMFKREKFLGADWTKKELFWVFKKEQPRKFYFPAICFLFVGIAITYVSLSHLFNI